jgi:hypothetical protein
MAQIAYTEKRPNCLLCHLPSFGAYVATYAGERDDELVSLCADCSFSRIYSRWSGFMSRKLKTLTLVVIYKLPGDKAAPGPKPELPDEDPFIPARYTATFHLDGDPYTAPIDPCDGTEIFCSPWAALERARQVSHNLARAMHLHSHWSINTAIHRLTNGVHPVGENNGNDPTE